MAQDFPESTPACPAEFGTTQWSLVLTAADGDSAGAGAALEFLCRAYWYPLYAHVRRRGHDAHAAQDLTQEFFARLLEKQWLKSVGRERGRFRTFLLVAMDHFLANARDHARAIKRGGQYSFVSLEDTQLGEERFGREAATEGARDGLFDRDWATAVLERALTQVEQDYAASGKGREFQDWRTFLGREATKADCEASAVRLGMTPGAVTVAVHRLRERYAAQLRREVARTLSDLKDLDEELHHLFRLLNQ